MSVTKLEDADEIRSIDGICKVFHFQMVSYRFWLMMSQGMEPEFYTLATWSGLSHKHAFQSLGGRVLRKNRRCDYVVHSNFVMYLIFKKFKKNQTKSPCVYGNYCKKEEKTNKLINDLLHFHV